MEAIQKAVLSLEDRNEQECLRCRYIDVIEDEEGNRKRLAWRDVALRVYRKDDENAIRVMPRLYKRVLESTRGTSVDLMIMHFRFAEHRKARPLYDDHASLLEEIAR